MSGVPGDHQQQTEDYSGRCYGQKGGAGKRVELQDISPPPEVQEAMEKQMRAERERRAAVLTAEGEKRAAILEAKVPRRLPSIVQKAKNRPPFLPPKARPGQGSRLQRPRPWPFRSWWNPSGISPEIRSLIQSGMMPCVTAFLWEVSCPQSAGREFRFFSPIKKGVAWPPWKNRFYAQPRKWW